MLARMDGRRPRLSFERYKVRAAYLAAEQRYGLRPTALADRTAARCASRAEAEKAARRGLDEPSRITLRRHVATAAAAAAGEEEFFARLEMAGVQVRRRFSSREPGQVTGYAVALPGDITKDGAPVWYGGGKLAVDLTWPKLRQRWTGAAARPAARLIADQRNAAWDQAARAAAGAAAHIRAVTGTNPDHAADAAWAAGDMLHAAAAVLGSRILRQAADAYDRAARPPHARIPAPTPAGNQLRQAARLISVSAALTRDPAYTPILLTTRLASLADAVAKMRAAQQRAAQADAALTAARHLQIASGAAPAAQPPGPDHAPTAASLAALSFPPTLPGRRQPPPGQPGLDQDRRPQAPGPTPPRPRRHRH